MFTTQYILQENPDKRGEETGTSSPVVPTQVRSNQEKIAQMMLAGQYIEGARLGYEFGPEDILPNVIKTRPMKKEDIVGVLDFTQQLGERIKTSVRAMRKKEDKNATIAVGVRKENEGSNETKTEAAGEGVSKNQTAGTDGAQG